MSDEYAGNGRDFGRYDRTAQPRGDSISRARQAMEAAETALWDARDAGASQATIAGLTRRADELEEAYFSACETWQPPRLAAATALAGEFGNDVSEWLV